MCRNGLSISTATRGNLGGLQRTDNPFNTFYGVANMQWEIDFWGKYRAATETARAQFLVSEYAHRAVQTAIISEVANAYFQLLGFSERLEISQRTFESRLVSTDIIQQRFDKGVVAEIDLNQAQIQEAIAAASIPQYERAMVQTGNALHFLLGRNPGNINTGT
ncbi:MAG: TolC family protein [Bacteroidales bacterium]|nr:TolC family protein [Bacteroidales bacterium]